MSKGDKIRPKISKEHYLEILRRTIPDGKIIVPRLDEKEYAILQEIRKNGIQSQSDSSLTSFDDNKKEYVYEEKGEIAWVEGYKITSLEKLLEVAKVDLNVWEVERFIVNKWDVTFTDKRKKAGVRTNFQVKAWLKKKTFIIDHEKFKKELIEDVKQYVPQIPQINYEKYIENTDNNLLEPNIYDLHLGKLAWAIETGGENYDTKIARELCMDAMNSLLTMSTAHFKINKILLTVGNDLFNSDKDHPFPQTTKGTPQESDLS